MKDSQTKATGAHWGRGVAMHRAADGIYRRLPVRTFRCLSYKGLLGAGQASEPIWRVPSKRASKPLARGCFEQRQPKVAAGRL